MCEEDTHLLQKILRAVKVLLAWGHRGTVAAVGTSLMEAEEDELAEDKATEAEVKGSSPSGSEELRLGGCCCSMKPLTVFTSSMVLSQLVAGPQGAHTAAISHSDRYVTAAAALPLEMKF